MEEDEMDEELLDREQVQIWEDKANAHREQIADLALKVTFHKDFF